MNVINLTNISKKYKLQYKKKKFKIFSRTQEKEFFALKNISIKAKKGSCIGIVGPNGSGKSTLLKIIGRLIKPSSGRLSVKGKTLCFLNIHAGFQQELTGRENVYLYSSYLGFSRKTIDKKFNEILAFSELEDFIDVKLKKYSDGMVIRLAFATTLAYDPDILLLDEILSVGDELFKKKSLTKILSLKKQGKTIMFVSHDLNTVKILSDKIIYLDKGEMKHLGKSDKIIEKYKSDSLEKELSNIEYIQQRADIILQERKIIEKIKREKSGFLKQRKLNEQIKRYLSLNKEFKLLVLTTKLGLSREIDKQVSKTRTDDSDELRNFISTLISTQIKLSEIELTVSEKEEEKKKHLEEINKFTYKQMYYKRYSSKKILQKKLAMMLKEYRISQDMFIRSKRIPDIVLISSKLELNSGKSVPNSLKKEINLTLDSIKINQIFNDIKNYKKVYYNLVVWFVFNNHYLEISRHFSQFTNVIVKEKNKQKVFEFIQDEFKNLMDYKSHDLILSGHIYLCFLTTLKKIQAKMSSNIKDQISSWVFDVETYHARVKRELLSKQDKDNSELLTKMNHLSVLKGKILGLNQELFGKYKNKSKVNITKVWFSDSNNNKENYVFSTNDPLVININYDAKELIEKPVFGVTFYSEEGFQIAGHNTKSVQINNVKGKGNVKCVIDRLPLLNGTYYVSVAVHPHDSFKPYDIHDKSYWFTVKNKDKTDFGVVEIEGEWEHIN